VHLLGVDIVIRSANGPERCVIDCEGTTEQPFRGFLIQSGESRATEIQGFTIRRGATLPGAIDDQFNGGGIRILGSSPTIRNCVFEDNLSGCWGGALYAAHGGAPLVTGCTFRNNYSDDDGGALFNWDGAHLEVQSCLFADNFARVTGGAVTAFDEITLRNVTIVGSFAPYGAAVYAFAGEISNSIVWGNGANPIDGSIPARYCLIEGGYPGDAILDMPPRFAPDGVHLRLDSPAIGAADPLFVPGRDERDIDGEARRFMGRVDMGADEYHAGPHRAR
jgi:hypothetical protein